MRAPTLVLVSALVASACATRVEVPSSPPAATRPTPVTTSSANDAILVLVPDSRASALFPEELEQLRRAVAERVAADVGPGRLLPFEAVDRVERLAREGRTREGGPVCAARPSAWMMLQTTYGRTLQLDIDARCAEPPCKLHVRLDRPPAQEGAYERVAEWEIAVLSATTTIGSAPWLDAARSLRRLEPEREAGGLLADLMGSDGKPRPLVEIDDVYALGAWADKPTAVSFSSVQPTLDACHEKGWWWSASEHAVLAVASEGTVSRCHLYMKDELRSDGRARCVCDALSRARFARASGDRRVEVTLTNSTSPSPTRDGLVFGARLDGLHLPRGMSLIGTNQRQLAACFADSRLAGPRRSRFRMRVDGAGNNVDPVVDEKDPDLKACLEKTLRAARSSCTPNGAPIDVAATLTLYSYKDQSGVSLRDLAK